MAKKSVHYTLWLRHLHLQKKIAFD